MDPKTPGEAPFKLELVEDPPRSVSEPLRQPAEPAVAPPPPAAPAHDTDRFLTRATREREEGIVDAALWSRALSLADGDEAAAVAPYLRARATVLKLAHDRALADIARHAPAPRSAAASAAPAVAPVPIPPAPGARRRPLLLALGAVGVVALGAVAWMLLASPEPAPTPAAATSVRSAQDARLAAAASVPAPVARPDPRAELEARVASLRAAGNWNVLVLYAAEWTRKDPQSAAAWHALSEGYANLKQVDEAFEAAKQAVALDPTNGSSLRMLARIYETLERPAEALAAVEQALALDPSHVDALALAGTLYARLARLPEARAAFDKVLAIDPANRASSCGALDVARKQGRTKDADALARAMKAAAIDCADAPQVAEAAAVSVGTRARR
ncbi:MAG TPA: tetratricopeptide repeat protein [Casimicrobiaceae bacterium]|nr:tetratricopeptide repeat protein [Casimicrobiaceae bacterium]